MNHRRCTVRAWVCARAGAESGSCMVEYRNPTVRVVGPAAIVRFNFVGEQEFGDGRKTPQNLAILMNWLKRDGEWKLLSRSATKL